MEHRATLSTNENAPSACHDDAAAVADVCQPRVRARLLVVGAGDGSEGLVALAAERLRIGTVRHTELADATAHLSSARASCVLIDACSSGLEPMAALTSLAAAAPDVPVVVLGADVDSTVALAAVQAGAQDYLVRAETDARSLERAIRHAIDRKRAAVELARLALHDPLTGLPNRSLFDDRLGHALARRRVDGTSVAVLFVDLDGFKRINESLGHGAGDRTLREAASRLRAAVRPHDTVARLGGDEFTVLCEDVHGDDGAMTIAQRIAAELGRALLVDGEEVVLRASIGVAVASDDGTTPEQLLRRSDDAMYHAKARGGGRPQLHTPRPERERAANDVQLEAALRRAIPGELVAHYQPVVELDGGRIVSAEALVRWRHPTRGLIPPGGFIPIAERSGLVVALGTWMLGEACRQATRWNGLRVSVNVSGRQVADGSLTAAVARALEESGLEPDRLQLELTETVLMDDVERHVAAVCELKELGVSLALDDFGKGYSSLSYLHRFPFDRIKIDRAFVDGLPDSRADVAIVSAVVSFAGALDMEVIAEGVETQAHVDALRDLGCELAQGFFFHRPTEPDEITPLLG